MRIENSINAPEYLDGEFFEEVLENGLFEAQVKTTDIAVTLGSNPGDNYLSKIFRVKINFKRSKSAETEQVSVIVKTMENDPSLQFLQEMEVFNKEKIFYLNVLPKLEILLDNVTFAPRCYFAKNKPINTIVFEDMTSAGYTMADREAGFNAEHTKLALKKLAQFHAVSMVYAKKEPEMIARFSTGFLDANVATPTSTIYKLLYKYLDCEIKKASEWEGYEEITKKLQEFQRNFQARLPECQKFNQSKFQVLNHGDFWVNNMLFKYEENTPKELVFIDFQLSIYGSPGFDLNYFFHASVQMDVLKNLEIYLRTYYDSLKDTLQGFHYKDIPTYDDILYEYQGAARFGLFTILGPLPVMTMDKAICGDNSFETLLEDDEKMKIAFSSKRLNEHLKYSLKALDSFGGLDK